MRSAPFAFAPFALLGLLGLSACSRAETAADRHMAEMNEAIASIQKDQDKGSKVGKIEVEDKSTLGLPSASSAPPAAKTGTPAPRVVQLGGDDSGESDDPNDSYKRALDGAIGRDEVFRVRSMTSPSACTGSA